MGKQRTYAEVNAELDKLSESEVRRKLEAGRDVIGLGELEDDEAEAGGGEVIDLMQLLRRSLGSEAAPRESPSPAAAGKAAAPAPPHAPARKAPRRAPPRKTAAPQDDLDEASKAQLQKLASELAVPGRSRLDKDGLLQAIRQARRAA